VTKSQIVPYDMIIRESLFNQREAFTIYISVTSLSLYTLLSLSQMNANEQTKIGRKFLYAQIIALLFKAKVEYKRHPIYNKYPTLSFYFIHFFFFFFPLLILYTLSVSTRLSPYKTTTQSTSLIAAPVVQATKHTIILFVSVFLSTK